MKAALPLVALFLSACAGTGAFPSLNPRPIEAEATALLQEPELPAVPPQPSDPKVMARIEAAAASALNSAAAFDAALADTDRLVTRAGPAQSDSWVLAHMSVSALEQRRYAVKSALADLDSLRRDLMTMPAGEDLGRLQERVAQIEALDARQDAAMQRLQAALSR